MILPTRHLPVQKTLLGAGAAILSELRAPMTVTEIWDRLQDHPMVETYDRLVLGLDLLFILGAIHLTGGTIRRVR